MTISLATSASPQSFDEDAWDDLLNYIEERRVIPIIGPDLLRVQTDRGLRPLYEWLAEKLAVRLSVDTVGLPTPLTLNDVLCCYLGQRGRREEAYTRLRSIRCWRMRSIWSATAARPRLTSSPMRQTASPTCRSSAASCSAPSSTTCSAGFPRRRRMSSPTRTCSSSSARCSPST